MVLPGCGGRVVQGAGPESDAIPPDSGDVSPADSTPLADAEADVAIDAPAACLVGSNVLCGSAECSSTCDETHGRRYERIWDSDRKNSPFGTCQFAAPPQCGMCGSDGHLCAASYFGTILGLDCVDTAVCDRLESDGFEDACNYTDTTRRTKTLVPTPACPPNGRELGMCGGACGACVGDAQCTGRSPTHPFGVCEPLHLLNSTTGDTIANRRCDFGVKYFSPWCPDGYACASFRVGSADDQVIADSFGFCLNLDKCKQLRSSLPGGLRCAVNGALLP
jgi:hypothetical protein